MLQQKSFQDKNILILGYGKSGVSAKNLLMPFAKNIFVYDKSFLIKILENKSENNLFLNQNNNFNNILTKKQKAVVANNNFLFEENNVFFENNIQKILKTNKIHLN